MAFISKEFLPKSSVDLGRLVSNKANPLEHYYQPPPDISRPTGEKVDSGTFESGESNEGISFSAKFLRYVSLSYSKRHARKYVIQSDRLRTYLLENSKQYFDKIIELEETKKFIERVLKSSGETCLIVGYKTLQDAVVTEFDKGFTSIDMNVILHGIGVGGNANRDDPILQTKKATGEQVFAVLYRKVKVKSRKTTILDLHLKGNEWYYLTRHRQAQIPETGDILEAEIGESQERDNFEFDEEDEEEDVEWNGQKLRTKMVTTIYDLVSRGKHYLFFDR